LPAVAQFTVVTGTITDPNGIPYANGTISATLNVPGGGIVTLNGQPYFPPSSPSGLNSKGSFTMLLGDNQVLAVNGTTGVTTWTFTVNCGQGCLQQAVGTGAVTFKSGAINITGSTQSLTSTLTALAPALTNITGGSGGVGCILNPADGGLACAGNPSVDLFVPSVGVGTGWLFQLLTSGLTITVPQTDNSTLNVTGATTLSGATQVNNTLTVNSLTGQAGGITYDFGTSVGVPTGGDTMSAPTSGTALTELFPSAPCAGILYVTNSGGTMPQNCGAQYQKLRCETGIGDGLNAIAAGTYLQTFCYNNSGVTWTITGLNCFTDNSGSSTLNAAGHTLGALLTGAITCSSSFASGTQSANVALTSGDYIQFTFVADGTSKQTTWVVSIGQ
jgi:hypothetical protein